MSAAYQEKPIRKIFYKALRFMLIADIVQSLQEVLLDYFISRHLGSDGLAAFGISYPLITVIMALMAWVVAGVQAVCARDISINDQRSARIHLCSGLTWGFLIMSAFALICWTFHYPLITVLGAADEYAYLRKASTQALLTGSLAGPFFCILMILLTNLIFNQKRKNALILGIISIAVQIITTTVVSDSFPTMAGIWSGYLLGLIISDFIILLYLRISTKNTESMFYDIRPITGFESVKDSLKTGFPELLCWIYSVLTFALRNNLVLRIGSKDALAAVTLRDGVEYGELLQTVVFYAVLVTIGTAYGSRDTEKYHAYVSTVAKSILRIAISGGIVLMRSFEDYYKGYENENGIHEPGYEELVRDLVTKFPLTLPRIEGEKNQKDFIALFGALLRMRNLLVSYDDFKGREILSDRDLQDYLGRYQDLRDEWKRKREEHEGTDINDDIVFEIELIKQVEINIDYILMLVKKYHDSNCQDKEVLITIQKAVDASPELRSKKKLIEAFVAGINDVDDVMNEWNEYVRNRRIEDMVDIIADEGLKAQATWNYMEACFRDGEIKTTGTDIDKILPPVSRFGGSGRAAKKQRVIDKLRAFFEKYFGIGTMFTSQDGRLNESPNMGEGLKVAEPKSSYEFVPN